MAESKENIFYRLPLFFIFCFIGSISTMYITALDINPIVASSLVSIIISFFTIIVIKKENRYSWASFCGSFAGMTCLVFLGFDNKDILSLNFFLNGLILSSLTALLYALSELFSYKFPKLAFDGYGGRLGTIAFISVCSFLIALKIIFDFKLEIFSLNNFSLSVWDFCAIPSAVLAAVVSMEIKATVSSLDENYKVFTVATTGIIGGILITKIPVYGNLLGQAWYTGAFVGMSSYFILMLKRDFIITGLISGILLVLTKGFFVGFGGKLGFISFMAVIITKASYSFFNKLSTLGEKRPDDLVASLQTGKGISNQNVDDDFAQRLVDSLMKAKESGEDINVNSDIGAGSFVIGEKASFNDDDDSYETPKKVVHNFDDLTENLKNLIGSFNSLNIDNWVYLTLVGGGYASASYQGLSEKTVAKTKFIKDSKFIQTLKNEKRAIGFSEKGMNQEIFTTRFENQDTIDTKMLIIFPIFEKEKLVGFFILFDNDEINYKNNFELIKKVIFLAPT